VRRSRTATIDAPAKVNLFLRILDRRADGYHEIETVFQLIDLADTVRVRVDPSFEGVSLTVRGPDLGPVEENLAYRAAVLFRRAFGMGDGIHIELSKRIPAGGGLGGGSSDAAAVLLLLRELTTRGDELREVAEELGSDVPFFLCGSTRALGRGRGELLTPLEPLPEAALVVALPPVHVSTASAYGHLSDVRGRPSSRMVDVPRTFEGATARASPVGWLEVAELATNDFQALVSAGHTEVEQSLSALRERGASLAMLSGSGAACFGVFPTKVRAEQVAAELTAALGWPFVASRTLSKPPRPSVLASEGGER
jgi:4-diphosphocytidyl-2-C-methyl-D-erythritol kinase